MPDVSLYLFIINIILGVLMYFMKQAHDNNKEQLTEQKVALVKLHEEVAHVKDKYYKKEEFRDFKEELWHRLDKMELNFEKRVQEVNRS